MSEIKHTPWTVSEEGYLVNAKGQKLADFLSCDVCLDDDQLGVVRSIIVSAPELLDELNQAVYAMDLMADILRRLVVDDQRCATFLAGLDAALSSARAAIAKAGGRS